MSLGSVAIVQSSCASTLPMASSEIFPMLRLPADILRTLLGTDQYLDNESRMVCRFVCRTFKVLTNVTYDEYDRSIFCANVAKNGNLNLLQWAHNNGAPIDYFRTFSSAASGGNLLILQYLARLIPFKDMPSFVNAAFSAARAGHLHVIQWLVQNHIDKCDASLSLSLSLICNFAAINGHLEILKWVKVKQLSDCNASTLGAAALNGHRHILEWALAKVGLNERTCSMAAKGRQLETLQWARSVGIGWDTSVCMHAASNGDLEMLQWARANGAPWDLTTCIAAAKAGHIPILQWARDNGADWNERVCSEAAEEGHLHVLQWLRENGAPWDEGTCESAFRMGHLSIYEWAREHDAPMWNEEEYDTRFERPPERLRRGPHILSKIKP